MAPPTLVALLEHRAEQSGARTVFTRWADRPQDERALTYAELDRRARTIGAALQKRGVGNERVLLLLPPGLSYIAAFFGCLYAGAVAVPCYPPAAGDIDAAGTSRRSRGLQKIRNLIRASTPRLAIVPASGGVKTGLAALDGPVLEVCPFDQLLHEGEGLTWQPPSISSSSLAFLQFTSGSTGEPRGVVLTHEHLLANSAFIQSAFGQSADSVVVSWLPPYHDMGLIGGIIQPVFSGSRCVLMPPVEFLQRPRRWLEAIQRHGADTSGGPNFAFDLCVRRIAPDQRAGLNLSSWTVAFTGAEPIRADTLKRFVDAFEPQGFRREALFPCYGLAEGTLAVTASRVSAGPRVAGLDRAALEERQAIASTSRGAKSVVSSGTPVGSLRVAIVEGDARMELPAGRVGEIWVNGVSVAGGYWNDPATTAETFQASLANGDGPFLRTGDLGFVDEDGHVFVVGRHRDLVIVHGRNHHPADIEATVEASHLVIRSGGCAAFGVQGDAGEALAIVAEINPRSGASRNGRHDNAALNAIATSIRAAVLAEHGVEPALVQLVAAGSIPRTTSGKTERYLCRERCLNRALPMIHVWHQEAPAPADGAARKPPMSTIERRVAAIWSDVLAVLEPGLDDHFFEVGGQSILALELVDRLEREFDTEVPLKTLIEHPTLGALAAFIEDSPRSRPYPSAASPNPSARFEPFPLTDVQEAYLYGRSTAFELGGVATQAVAEFEVGDLDVPRLAAAVNELVKRHDMLRAIIGPDGQQIVLPEVASFPIDSDDISVLPAAEQQHHLAAVRTRLSQSMLPVDTWPLFQIVVRRVASDRVHLFARFDLLIADLYSLRLLWRQLGELYNGSPAGPVTSSLAFRDVVVHERQSKARGSSPEGDPYWRQRLPLMPPAPELPYTRPFRAITSPIFRRRSAHLDAQAWARLKQRAQTAHATPAAVLLAAFSTVLATWSRHPRFTLTLTFFNRPRLPDVDRIVGDFTSLLLVDVDASALDFAAIVSAAQAALWEALAHRQSGGISAIRELARLQGRSAQAIAPVVFTCAIGQDEGDRSSPWSWLGDIAGGVSSTPQVVLDHQVQEDGDRLLLSWDTIEALFPEGVVDEMFAAYQRLLAWLTSDAEWRDALPMLVPVRQLAVMDEANATRQDLAPNTLHGLFLRAAALYPDRPALIDANGTILSYRDLEQRSRAVARWLAEHDVVQDRLVAIVARKGWEQIVAALGVVRAGGTYLPIDPALPEERRWHLLERGDTELVLTQRDASEELAWPPDVTRGVVEEIEPAPDGIAAADPTDWQQPAYVIFTSGSTGQPKGVTIDHRGAVNTIVDLNTRFGIGPGDRVCGISALGFDLSVYDVFGTLAAGATLVLPSPDHLRNPEHWLQLLNSQQVTLWNSVPALFEMLCDYTAGADATLPLSLRLAWLSGDWIPVSLPDRARALRPGLEIVSMGGATEASIWSVLYPIGRVDPSWRSIPYGRPMHNQRLHVLDEGLRQRPLWVAGDLYIGGIGVAVGYWRDRERTAGSFVDAIVDDGRLYRTGDLARWLPDGTLEFLGRDDGQVKIGGLRIELGEIEAALNSHPKVRQAVVVARHLDGAVVNDASAASRRQLVAFVVPAAPGALAGENLALFLAQKLPSGMVPRRFVELDELPLSGNGKVDTTALAAPAPERARHRWRPEPTEAAVRAIWAEVLGVPVDTIGPADNFFDLGGSSVTIVQVAGAISYRAGRAIPLLTLFERSTVPEMAALLSETRAAQADQAVDVRVARRKARMSSMRVTSRTPSPSAD